MVTTVYDQKQLFTKRGMRSARCACKLSQTKWSPSLHTFFQIVDRRSLKDCDITWENLRNAETI